jgi:hypothetical protein
MEENTDKIQKLEEKLLSDLEVQEQSEQDYLLSLGTKIARWQSYYSKAKRKEYFLNSELDFKYKELYMYYLHEFNTKLDKKDIGVFIYADNEYRKLRSELQEIQILTQFSEKAIKTLESQQWALKTRLDYLQIYGIGSR